MGVTQCKKHKYTLWTHQYKGFGLTRRSQSHGWDADAFYRSAQPVVWKAWYSLLTQELQDAKNVC